MPETIAEALGSNQLEALAEPEIRPYQAEQVPFHILLAQVRLEARVGQVGALSTFEQLKLRIHTTALQDQGGQL